VNVLAFITADDLARALGMTAPTTDVTSSAAAANQWLTGYLTVEDPADSHLQYDYLKRAALMVGVDMYAAPKAAGGQSVDAELAPSPYLMGSALMRRIAGMVAPRRATAGLVG
jgi:hypothetical protein